MDRLAVLRAYRAQLLRSMQQSRLELVVNRGVTPVSKRNQLEGL